MAILAKILIRPYLQTEVGRSFGSVRPNPPEPDSVVHYARFKDSLFKLYETDSNIDFKTRKTEYKIQFIDVFKGYFRRTRKVTFNLYPNVNVLLGHINT